MYALKLFLTAALLFGLDGGVCAQDEALGRTLVSTYCAGCHAIEPTGASDHPDAPPFRDLHERYDVDFLSEALVEGLVSGHPDMPEYAFDPSEAAAIISYLEWLSNW